ncbi:MAG: hypothetical protein ACK55I_35415, partial [bacterium]
AGLGQAEVVGAAEVPAVFPHHAQQPQAGVIGEFFAAPGGAAAPVDHQVFIGEGQGGEARHGDQQVLPPVHAHRDDAQAQGGRVVSPTGPCRRRGRRTFPPPTLRPWSAARGTRDPPGSSA